MTTRYDISRVPPQGGYVAKQCPVRAQNDALHPAEPREPSAFRVRLFSRGREFEALVFEELLRLNPDAVVVDGGGDLAEAATLEAMAVVRPSSSVAGCRWMRSAGVWASRICSWPRLAAATGRWM